MHRVRLAVRENRLSDPTKVQPEDYVTMLSSSGAGWVAKLQDRTVGFAVADLTRRSVWALFVEQGHEEIGIGRALHDTMMSWFCDQGAEEISLSTGLGTRAVRFYLAAGWEQGDVEDGELKFRISCARWREQNQSTSNSSRL